MFQGEGVDFQANPDAIHMEEVGCHGNQKAMRIRTVSHPLALWVLSAHWFRFWTLPLFYLPQASTGIINSHFRDLAPSYWLLLES